MAKEMENWPAAARRSGEELLERMQASPDWSSNGPFRRAIKVFDDALRLYKPSEIVLSFNGGKDATVLLHLARAAVAGFLKESGAESGPTCLRCVYFAESDGFDEMEDFIVAMESTYKLEIERFPGGFKDGCEHMIKNFAAKAFILGTRKSDPHGKFVESFSPSSAGWPSFMRVHPILSWEYDDVWRFLTEMSLEYCVLYDRGYTSIGRKDNTEKNPLLLQPDGSFLPAHLLKLQAMDPLLERHGRRQSGGNDCDSAQLCTAAIVTIGNEVLSAKVQDVNTNYAARVLRSCGVVLRRVAILPDKTEEIAKAVKEMAADCTAVITIGGIGPTHDDVTFRAVAEGLGKGLVHNVEMEGFLRQFKRRPSQEEAGVAGPNRADLKWDTQKMCLMPGDTELLMEHGKEFPLLRCGKVYMLPGVPQFMRQQIDHAGRLLKKSGCAFHCRQIRLSVEEALVAKAITATAEEFPNVEVGSYPYYNGSAHKTIVMLEGRCNTRVDLCQVFMTEQIPDSYIISADSDPTLPPS